MAQNDDKQVNIPRTITGRTEINTDYEEEENSLREFGYMMLILELILIIFFWVFVRDEHNDPADLLWTQRYPAFQDVNVMILIGFGFLMTFIRSYAWSAISYTFLINAFISQYYVLFSNFWLKVFEGGWSGATMTI